MTPCLQKCSSGRTQLTLVILGSWGRGSPRFQRLLGRRRHGCGSCSLLALPESRVGVMHGGRGDGEQGRLCNAFQPSDRLCRIKGLHLSGNRPAGCSKRLQTKPTPTKSWPAPKNFVKRFPFLLPVVRMFPAAQIPGGDKPPKFNEVSIWKKRRILARIGTGPGPWESVRRRVFANTLSPTPSMPNAERMRPRLFGLESVCVCLGRAESGCRRTVAWHAGCALLLPGPSAHRAHFRSLITTQHAATGSKLHERAKRAGRRLQKPWRGSRHQQCRWTWAWQEQQQQGQRQELSPPLRRRHQQQRRQRRRRRARLRTGRPSSPRMEGERPRWRRGRWTTTCC